ncbi:MAG: metallophosphatase family protein [Proteobacteria bacterium]|nr:metallophosphatase family protein [Pseudomonadota bacterium]
MFIAVLADIHGNLEAFRDVLARIRTRKVDRIFSLGDNVGYGPDPEAVMELIRKNTIESVLGNHEKAMNEESFISWFNPLAQKAVRYTRDHLSDQSLLAIKDYPKSRVFEKIRFVHGAPPSSPVLYLFQLTDDKLAKRLHAMDESLCFAGHTHDLGLITYDGTHLVHSTLPFGETRLDPDLKYLINVGSVGQPRDGDNRAKYVLYDTRTRILTLEAVPYDNRTTADKIIKAGIPEQYAQKLL